MSSRYGHGRHSIRLKDFDYSQMGSYFVTICTHRRQFSLGRVRRGRMHLSATGRIAEQVWRELPDRYPGVQTDAFVVMPNHVHGIIVLPGEPVGAGPCACPTISEEGGQPQGVAPTMSLSDVVHRFKSLTATWRRQRRGRTDQELSRGRLWQRNYYEHVIRNERCMNRIRQYILTNPSRWTKDRENPERTGEDGFDRWLAGFRKAPGGGRRCP